METNLYPPSPASAHRYRPRIILALVIVSLMGASFFGGMKYGESRIPSIERVSGLSQKELGKPDSVDFSLFWDAWRAIEENYVGRNNLDRTQMVYGAIAGMVESLGDPYTVFFSPAENKKFEEDLTGTFSGIGAEIGKKSDVLTVIAPLPQSPAERAGLRAGDKILKINDEESTRFTVEEAVTRIRGEKGTEVRLTIAREGEAKFKEFSIKRDVVVIPPLVVERKSSPGRTNDVVYIRLLQFNEEASHAFQREAGNILKSDAKRIVLDLRNNPGGFLDTAVDLAGWFLPSGTLVVTEEPGGGKRQEFHSSRRGQLHTYPLVVLINEGSASASEILAGALRDNRDIPLVGKKTFGKGSVQNLRPLREGTAVKITVAKWLTPRGHSINESGLEPTRTVEITEADANAGKDPQLEKALEIVGKL